MPASVRLRRTAALEGAAAAVAGGVVGGVGGLALHGLLWLFAGRSLGLHDHNRLGAGNRVTLVRAVLVSLLAGLLLAPAGSGLLAAGVAAAALALDGVDGWAARRSGTASAFGARLDMELDALTVLVLSALVWHLDRTGAWVLASGALRYLFVAAGWGLPWLRAPLPSSLRAQVICVLQVGGLLLCLLPWPVAWVAPLLAGLGLALLVFSFGVDVLGLWKRR